MTRRFVLLTLLALPIVTATVAVASAADLVTPMTFAGASDWYYCTANNTSPTYKITVRVRVINYLGLTLVDSGNSVLSPGHGTAYSSGGGTWAYCRITTTYVAYTRASLVSFDSGFHMTSTVEAR
jgi:hypothetical protein